MNNKPLKKSYQNAIAKIRELGFTEPPTSQTRTNPYSGQSCELEPLAVMIYDFVTTRTLVCGQHFTQQTWDNCRYVFMTLWPDAYMTLID